MTWRLRKIPSKTQPKHNLRLAKGLPQPTAVFLGSKGLMDALNAKQFTLTNSALSVGQVGLALSQTANGYLGLSSTADILFPSSYEATIIFYRKKKIATLGNVVSFGYAAAGNTEGSRVMSNCPWSDGNIYWDFGNIWTGRLVASGLSFSSNPECYIFIAGAERGREIWRDGKLEASSSANAPRSSYIGQTYIGCDPVVTSVADSDNEEVYLFAVFPEALSQAQCREISANPYSIFEPRSRQVFSASASASNDLSGLASSASSATGAITGNIEISGATISIASTTGAINQSVAIAGSAADVVSANGVATVNITLSGNGFVQTAASGALNQAMPLVGTAQGAADGQADLSAGTPSSLDGSAAIASAGTGQINLTVTLSGAAILRLLVAAGVDLSSTLSGGAQDTVSAAANLDPGSGLSGAAGGSADGSGGLILSIPITGSAQAVVTGSTGLSSTILLSEAAVIINKGTGDITVGVGGLTGAAIINALAGGNIALSVSVSAAALARSLAAATLSATGDYVLPVGDYAIDSRSALYEMSSRTPSHEIRNYYAH